MYMAGVAAPAWATAAQAAMYNCCARSAVLRIAAAPLQLRLFSADINSVLLYGAEEWGMQLVAKAAAGCGSTGCAAEKLRLGHLRRLLGVHQGTPSAVVLAETGERPL